MFTRRIHSLILTIVLISAVLSCKGRNGRNEVPSPSGMQDRVPEGELALKDAALNGQFELAAELVGKGINVNAKDPEGRTALMYASFNGHAMIVRLLLESGAVVDMRDGLGRTALLFASTGPFPETVKLLLENDADPNISDAREAFTPLMHAAAEGLPEVVKILLEYGADPSSRDVDGDNAITFALQNGHLEVAELLRAR